MTERPGRSARCSECGTEAPAGARFCSSCAAPLGAAPDGLTRTATPTEQAAAVAREPAPGVGRLASSDTIAVGGFTPGAILADRYRIIGLLGRGGMGEVYRADDLTLGQPVALKFLPRELASDPVRRERFLAEVRIARQVSHPNLCRVYDIGELQETGAGSREPWAAQFFLTMEYIDGEDLASLLRRIGFLHGQKALDIARQLCAGLAAAHDKGVLHRDLKPANVMIDGRGRARITDFGLALAAGDTKPGDEMSGTPAYMAPEQLAGQGATARSDIYALGLVLYELYTGKRTFDATTLAELRAQKESATPRAPSEITRDMDSVVERVILRCLEKDPRARPSSVAHVAAALPGGDPLAAALAAGETPSPEVVAAAGEKDGLRPATAWALVACIVVGALAAVPAKDRFNVFLQVQPEKSPDALMEQARDILASAGHAATPTDWASGWEINQAFIDYFDDSSPSRQRSPALDRGAVRFWYRQSPRPLAHLPLMQARGLSPGNPPLEFADEALVELDPRGRLIAFRVIPPELDPEKKPGAPIDWRPLFTAAGLEPALWTPSEPRRSPAFYADQRAAWTGTLAQLPETPVRIDAASYRGQAVWFEITGPWTRPLRQPVNVTPVRVGIGRVVAGVVAGGLSVAVPLLVFGGGLVFARRNLRLGRGDRRGATRLAVWTASLTLIAWVFGEDHVSTSWEVVLVVNVMGFSLLAAAIVWVLYIALEPFVRRRRPHLLVTWTRILSGEWQDPLVGRDVLIGSAAGVGMAVVDSVPALAMFFGYPRQALGPLGSSGMDSVISALAGYASVESTFFSLAFLFLVVALEAMVRRPWRAVLVLLMLPAASAAAGPTIWIDLPDVLLLGVRLLVLTRVGLLAGMVNGFVYLISSYPMTFDTSAWYASAGYVHLAVVAALAFYGFRTSLGGRSMLGRTTLEE